MTLIKPAVSARVRSPGVSVAGLARSSFMLSTSVRPSPSPLDVAGRTSARSVEGQGYSGPIATFLDSDTAPAKPYLFESGKRDIVRRQKPLRWCECEFHTVKA